MDFPPIFRMPLAPHIPAYSGQYIRRKKSEVFNLAFFPAA